MGARDWLQSVPLASNFIDVVVKHAPRPFKRELGLIAEPDVEGVVEKVRRAGGLGPAELSLVVEALLLRNENAVGAKASASKAELARLHNEVQEVPPPPPPLHHRPHQQHRGQVRRRLSAEVTNRLSAASQAREASLALEAEKGKGKAEAAAWQNRFAAKEAEWAAQAKRYQVRTLLWM